MPTKIKKQHENNVLNKLVLVVAVVEPLMTLPQIYQIWTDKDASGVSAVTWLGYMIAALIWLFYGLKIKDKPIIISSTLWIITEGFVVLGALRY
jgi:uncharacterized protein with PQ loop repeat